MEVDKFFHILEQAKTAIEFVILVAPFVSGFFKKFHKQ